MEDVITVAANLSTKGFEKGSKAMQRAVNSLGKAAQQMGRATERGVRSAMGSVKRLIPMILGVGSVYGIISKAVSAFMSQNEELASKMNSIWTALGNVLAPIITQIINWVTTAVSYFLEFLRLLGVTGKTASELSKKANSSAGQLQKTLAGFDELNVLNKDTGTTLSDVDPSEWMSKLAELLKNKMWDEAAGLIIDKMNRIIYKVRDKAYEVGKKIGEYLQGIIHVIARVLDEVDWKQLGVGFANFFNGLLKEIEGINLGEDLGKILVAKFTIGFKILTGFLETFDGKRLAEILSGIITGAFGAATRAIEEADFKEIGKNIAEFFNNIDWEEIADAIFGLLSAAWDGAVELLHSFLTNVDWAEIGRQIRAIFERIDVGELASGIYLLLKDAWEAAWDLLLGLLGEGMDNEPPIVGAFRELKGSIEELGKAITDTLGPLWDGVLQPLLEWSGEFIIPSLIDDLTGTIRDVADAINLLFELFESAARIIKGDFSGGFEQAKGALGEFFDSINNNKHFVDSLLEKFGLMKPKLDEVSSAMEIEGQKSEETGRKLEHSKTTHQEVADSVGALSGITSEYNNSLSEQERILEKQKNVVEDVANAVTAEADAVTVGAESTRDAAQAAQEAQDASRELSGETQNTSRTFGELESAVSDSSKHMRNDFEAGLTEMGKVASDETQDMNNVFATNFGIIANNAFYWGQDVIYSFNNGLISAMNSVLVPTMENIAMAIRNYIGFSEPKVGPLSDFHTFAPDMMELFASGIEREKSTVLSSVENVAAGVSDAFENSDFSIGANMAALSSIGANVPFQMPIVAGGGIIPYSVGNGSGYGQASESEAAVLIAVERLSELVRDFHNDVQNMQWVLQFGKERAVVQEITRMQKQMERAVGR